MSDEKKIEKIDVNSDFQDNKKDQNNINSSTVIVEDSTSEEKENFQKEQPHKDPIQEENKQELKVENSKTLNLTDENFEEKVIKSNKPVVVDFWAEWCGPCKQIAPTLEEISNEMVNDVVIAKHNIDNEPNTPTKYGIRGIPTMLLFSGGELKATKVGATTKSNIVSWIKENI